jgi:hypothetical protein
MRIIQDNCFRIILGIFLIGAGSQVCAADENVPYDRILRDHTIVAPGYGSEGVLVNEEIEPVLKRFGRMKFKISKSRNTGELFKDVFKVNSSYKLYFESLYYHEENKFTVCVFQGKVVALIGFNNNRITTDSVNMRSGINSFIFYYGKRSLRLIKADSNGIYLYPDRGIAVVDDGMNDSIDLYIVFAIDNGKKK